MPARKKQIDETHYNFYEGAKSGLSNVVSTLWNVGSGAVSGAASGAYGGAFEPKFEKARSAWIPTSSSSSSVSRGRTPRSYARSGKKSGTKKGEDSDSDSENEKEVILPCDTLDNLNDALFYRGTKAKVEAISASMKSQAGATSVENMCRIVVPPTKSDDTLHVARIVRYMVSRDIKTTQLMKTELRANINISGAHVRPRSSRTPRTPRTADAGTNDRSLNDNFSELNILLSQYDFNVAAIQEDDKELSTKIISRKAGNSDWLVLFITPQRHLEILASKNKDGTYGVIFTMKDDVFKDVMNKLHYDLKNKFVLR